MTRGALRWYYRDMPIWLLVLLGGAGAAWYLKKKQEAQSSPGAAPSAAPTAAVGSNWMSNLPPPVCGQWIAIGPGVSGVPSSMRSMILATMPMLALHPQLPPSGTTFTASAGSTLVAWYNAGGMVVPVAYCAVGAVGFYPPS